MKMNLKHNYEKAHVGFVDNCLFNLINNKINNNLFYMYNGQ